MTDMPTYLMLDDVNLELLDKFADKAHAVAGYVNGSYANWSEVVARYGKTDKFLLSIDVANRVGAGAQALDIESGDAVIKDAPGWFQGTRAAGIKAKDYRCFPKLYTSLANLEALVAEMDRAGIKRNEYMIWSAHYTDEAHICGPKSCGSKVQADATQYTETYQGVSLDASLCFGYFFSGPDKVSTAHPAKIRPLMPSPSKPAPKPEPKPAPKPAPVPAPKPVAAPEPKTEPAPVIKPVEPEAPKPEPATEPLKPVTVSVPTEIADAIEVVVKWIESIRK